MLIGKSVLDLEDRRRAEESTLAATDEHGSARPRSRSAHVAVRDASHHDGARRFYTRDYMIMMKNKKAGIFRLEGSS